MRKPPRVLIPLGVAVILAVGLAAGFGVGRGTGGRAAAGADPGPTSTASTVAPMTTTTTPTASTDKPGKSGSASFTATSAPPVLVSPPAGLPSLPCPAATVTVHDSAGLQAALDAAHPGAVIHLADGVYYGRFHGTGAGTPSDPIWVCGGPMAILDDSQQNQGPAPAQKNGAYGFHLVSASWWNLVGFSIRNAQKGVVLDHSDHNTLHRLNVYNIGDEAIHLREFSSDNVVEGCVIRDTGLRVAKYGEGIYLGTSVHNWGTYTAGQPDASDRNKVRYNDISRTTAENIDIKEGTSAGELAFNHLDGTGMVASAATAWVNVKGNGYSVHGNTGENSIGDGFSTHKIVTGSGTGNVFSNNHIGAGVTGYGFAFHSHHNTLTCDNTGQGEKGQANVSCTK